MVSVVGVSALFDVSVSFSRARLTIAGGVDEAGDADERTNDSYEQEGACQPQRENESSHLRLSSYPRGVEVDGSGSAVE